MNDLIILLIEYFRLYSVWFLGIVVILQFNGVPLGANLVVIASGVLAYSGEFNILALLGEVWLFTVLGDSLSFLIWKRIGGKIFLKFPYVKKLFSVGLQKAEGYYARHGKLTILITRFPVSALGPVVNITAGTARLRFYSFLMPAVFGDFLWTAFNLGVGYWFGDSWEEVAMLVSQFGILTVLFLSLLVAAYLLKRIISKKKTKITT